ncbi:MAG: SlyX family protein [Kiritimatiellaceae bacterium]|nr:SlyX family protein [Kiritimatiellaceae bacterium]
MEDRLTKLEMLYADQSRMVEEMSAEMYQQQQDIVRLTRKVLELENKIESMDASNEIGGNERPPHY